MAQDLIVSQLEGIVACANDRGFKLEGRDGWLNISKFSAAAQVPPAGAPVRVGLDKAGFVRETELLSRDEAAVLVPSAPSAPVDRDARIMRQAVLNTATNILMSNGSVNVADVLDLAARLEAWVTR